jgi:hypothetical protein
MKKVPPYPPLNSKLILPLRTLNLQCIELKLSNWPKLQQYSEAHKFRYTQQKNVNKDVLERFNT